MGRDSCETHDITRMSSPWLRITARVGCASALNGNRFRSTYAVARLWRTGSPRIATFASHRRGCARNGPSTTRPSRFIGEPLNADRVVVHREDFVRDRARIAAA